jgi:ankyrin repeat protein
MEAIVKNDMKTIEDNIDNIDVLRSDYDSRTFLHVACSEGNIDVAKLLIEKGANFTADRWGNTPITDLERYMNDKSNTNTLDGVKLEKISQFIYEHKSDSNSPKK